MKKITIIIPVYNEEKSILPFYEILKKNLDKNKNDFEFEIMFSNNCSTDKSLEIIKELSLNDNRIKILTLSRNFGYQLSLLAALNNVQTDAAIMIDVDNEDPPELINKFLYYYKKGYKIVYGERNKRPEFFLINFLRKLFYRFTKLIADYRFNLDMAEFSLISKDVINIIVANNSSFPFLRNEIAYAGFKSKAISYDRNKRLIGKSHYNLLGMLKFAVAGILTTSTFPLRLNLWLSILIGILNILVSIFFYSGYLSFKDLTIILFLEFTLLFFLISFISIYISRIYKDVISRPKFIVDFENSFNL